MKTIKFNHISGKGKVFRKQSNDPCVANYHEDGGFSIDYYTPDGELVVDYGTWTAEDADKLFEHGMWVKVEPEVIKFRSCRGTGNTIYTADFDVEPGKCIVSWQYDDGVDDCIDYPAETARQFFEEGSWVEEDADFVEVKEPQPEPTDIQKARVLIGEQNLMVHLQGTGYHVDGFNSYKAKNDAELLKICQLLEELAQYE